MITSDDQLEEKARDMGIKLNSITNKDNMPSHTRPGAYIINMQDSLNTNHIPNPGTHWTGLWIENNHAIYFDPFGLSPPANVQLFIQRYDPLYSVQQVQNERSGWCGYYVLLFLWFMSYKKRLTARKRIDAFLHLFNLNPIKNLDILHNYLKHLIGK